MREATLPAVRFPDSFRPPGGSRGTSRVLSRVDDPVADRIKKGDPTLGWEGDNRLQLYLDVPEGRWELWRLEHDGEMRRTAVWSVDQYRANDVVPAIILWLVAHDQRRGFDPHLHVVAHNDRVAATRAAEAAEQSAEAAERLVHGLRKDGAL